LKTLQNTQNLKEIERLNSNSQKSTQNLEELGFLELPQNDRWKHRSYSKDHVFGVGFEFGSFNLLESRVYYQTVGGRMERIRLGGEKWGRNKIKIRFQQFLLRPVRIH